MKCCCCPMKATETVMINGQEYQMCRYCADLWRFEADAKLIDRQNQGYKHLMEVVMGA